MKKLISVLLVLSLLLVWMPTSVLADEAAVTENSARAAETVEDGAVPAASGEITAVLTEDEAAESETARTLKTPEESLGLYSDSDGSQEGMDYLAQECDPEGPVLTGMVSQETLDWANEQADYILNESPASSGEVLGVIGAVSDGLFSTEENALDLVTLQESTTLQGKTGYIYVVDENAAVFLVKDQNDNYLAGATVTISYLDDSGNRVTRSVLTSGGNMPGVAAFDNMSGTRYGVIDVSANGYHSITLLEEEITGGNKRTFTLTESTSADEVYIRGADLDGKDLIHSDTTINLFTTDAGEMTFSILVTKTGNATLPKSVSLLTEDGRGVASFTSCSSYETAGVQNTYLFTYTAKWVNQTDPLLFEGDRLQIWFDGTTFSLSSVTVRNAIVDPSYDSDADLPIAGDDEESSGFVPVKGVDQARLNLSLINLKVSVAYFPDGSFTIMAMKDIESCKKSFDDLLPKTTSPKTAEQVKGIMDNLKQSYLKSMDTLKKSAGTLKSQTEAAKAYCKGSFSISYGICFTGKYDEATKMYSGDLDLILQADAKFSDTIYSWFMAGPVMIPFYFGFEMSLGLKTDFDIGVSMPNIIGGPYSWSDKALNLGIHLLPNASAFLGTGVRGTLGVDIATILDFDLCAYPYNRKGDGGYIDATADLKLNYYYLLGSGTYTFCTTGKQRIVPKSDTSTELSAQVSYSEIDLDLTEEQITEQIALTENADGTITLPSYTLDADTLQSLTDEAVNGTQRISQLVSFTYPDNQVQLVEAEDYVAMFRIISKDGKTKLVYQLQDSSDGLIDGEIYEIQVPDDQSVTEYCAIPVKATYLGDKRNYVYIAAVCADETVKDVDERAKTTSVCGITINLRDHTELYCKTLAEADGTYHFNPKPAGYWEQCLVAYSTSESYQDKSSYTSYMVTVDGKTVKIGDNTPVFTTGDALNDSWATFWYVNNEKSDENTAKLEAMNLHGFVPDDWTCHLDLDVSGYTLDEGENYVTAWCYEDSISYFIAMGKVYYIERYRADDTSMTDPYIGQRATELTYDGGKSADLGGSENTYQIFSNHAGSAIYIACAKPVYTVTDEETLSTECIGTQVEIYSILCSYYYGRKYVSMHGTRDIFIPDVKMTTFSTAFTRKTDGNGMVIVYSVSPSNSYSNLYEWQENASDGMIITGFEIQDPVITNTQQYIAAKVTIKNVGYKTGGLVGYRITDSSGKQLTEANYWNGVYTDLPADTTHWNNTVYPDDSDTYMLYFRTNPDWKTDSAEAISIQLVLNGADDDALYTTDEAISLAYTNGGEVETYSTSYTLEYDEPYLELDGRQVLENGRHVAELSIQNLSVLQADQIGLAVVGVYSGDASDYDDETMLTGLHECLGAVSAGSTPLLNRNVAAGTYSAVIYNLDVDLESIWTENTDTALRGVNLYLVDGDGRNVDEQVVYLANPYYTVSNTDIPFEDVADDDYFYNPVCWAYHNSITCGTSAGTFSPADSCSRAEFVTFLWRAAGEPEPERTVCPFLDLSPSAYYYKAVLWACENGITIGTSDIAFSPDTAVTRAQAVTLIWRYLGKPEADSGTMPFTDVSDGTFCYDPVCWAVQAGVTEGTSDTTFSPDRSCSRAQAVTFLYRACS